MGWAKLTDRRSMNPKLRRCGFEARGLDEAAICQIAADETDGIISEDAVEMLAIGHKCKNWRRLVDILVRERRWEPVDGGWIVKGYLKHNPSRSERDADRERKRAAGQRGGYRSGESRRSRNEAGASPRDKQPASDATNSRPVPVPVPGSVISPMASNTMGDDEVAGGEEPDLIVKYWLTACLGQQPGQFKLRSLLEAKACIDHLRRFLDERVIEERIGVIANSKAKPRSANYLMSACRSWAAEQGIQVPPHTLATRQPPPDLDQHKEPA